MGSLYKWQTKKIAKKLGLNNSIRPESQDICFIPNGDYSSLIINYAQSAPGYIIDTEGQVLGKHKGLPGYTIGQRQGLGLDSNRRMYVIKLDAEKNILIVGGQEHLYRCNLNAIQLSWVSGQPTLDELDDITARIRYRSPEVEVSLNINQDNAEVQFKKPQKAIAPGQSIVFYRGDFILGGGVIESPK
jgi:tRNA-specific 2-thiouridylase